MKTSLQVDYNRDIQAYFNDIDRYKPLSKKDERKIGRKIKRGDRKAKDELITSNLKFVINIAKLYKGYGVPFSDLISEGNIGLIKAAEKFDYKKDVKFISYGVWWIKQSIQDYLRRNKIIDDIETLDNDMMIDKSIMDEDGNEMVNSFDNNHSTSSDDINNELIDNRKKIVLKLLTFLSERETLIISDYFGLHETEELTLEEIGRKYNLTKERVRQIKEKALRKIRSNVLLLPEFEKIQTLQ